MLELRYIELDENNFVKSITTQETETSIGLYVDTMSSFALGFRKYRYDKETNNFIYDESNVIDECKESLKQELKEYMIHKKDNRFGAYLESGNYTFNYSNNLRRSLIDNQSLIGLGINNLFKIPCVDSNGAENNIKISTNDLKILLTIMVEFEESLDKMIDMLIEIISKFRSLEELNNFKNKYMKGGEFV